MSEDICVHKILSLKFMHIIR